MTVNNVAIIDLETTGLDPEKSEVIELGVILYSVKYQTILQQFSTLLPVYENPQKPVNKINLEAARSLSDIYKGCVFEWLKTVEKHSDYFVAHNADFDKLFSIINGFDTPWLCTFSDFIWPKNEKPTNLINTCLNHGIAVKSAHRALTDCQLIAELFDRADDLQGLFEKAIARSKEPTYRVIARISYDDREQAKEAGFHWDGNNKQWFKVLRLSDFKAQKDNWAFSYGFTSCKDD